MDNLIDDISILSDQEKEACEVVKVSENKNTGKERKLYIESYGCQMNFSD
ncbi:MAG: tRNA (N6-isopentenyl adenosine(37)-C2)-methylthiotransferase MiaB, partial [Bacteroidota bacterium]